MATGKKSSGGWFLWLILCAAAFAGGYYYHYWKTFKQSEYTVKCVNVLDGDTIDVEWFGGVSRLRVVGIDTFETRRGKKIRDQAEEYGLPEERALQLGEVAKEIARKNLLDREITIKFPSGSIERDSFGRLLAYVFVDDADYGIHLMTEGLAYPRPEDHKRDKYYDWPVIQAKNDKKGMYAR